MIDIALNRRKQRKGIRKPGDGPLCFIGDDGIGSRGFSRETGKHGSTEHMELFQSNGTFRDVICADSRLGCIVNFCFSGSPRAVPNDSG
jgi:hypothetical protein